MVAVTLPAGPLKSMKNGVASYPTIGAQPLGSPPTMTMPMMTGMPMTQPGSLTTPRPMMQPRMNATMRAPGQLGQSRSDIIRLVSKNEAANPAVMRPKTLTSTSLPATRIQMGSSLAPRVSTEPLPEALPTTMAMEQEPVILADVPMQTSTPTAATLDTAVPDAPATAAEVKKPLSCYAGIMGWFSKRNGTA